LRSVLAAVSALAEALVVVALLITVSHGHCPYRRGAPSAGMGVFVAVRLSELRQVSTWVKGRRINSAHKRRCDGNPGQCAQPAPGSSTH
jgi:hypothetical protein